MIRFLQKKGTTQKFLWAILIGIVCVSMVAFLGSYFTDAQGGVNAAGVYATVGNQKITVEQIRETAQAMGRQQFQGRDVPEQLLKYFMSQAATREVMRRAVLEEADRMDIRVTDDEVLAFFHKGEIGRQLYPNGKYVGREQAARIIAANTNNMSPEKFQQAIKEDLTFQKLLAIVQGQVVVPESEIQAEYRKQNVKVKFDYALISSADLAKTITVTEPELKAYYEKHKAELKDSLPEQRKIRYMVLDSSKDPVTITDSDYQQAYNQSQEEFKIPEQVDVRHILVKTKEQALDLKKQLEGGADFTALAKKYSDDPGSKDNGGLYKNVEHGKMVPEFDKAAFSLPVGKISDPVQTNYGFHILKVDAHRPAGTRSLADVKSELTERIRSQKQRAAVEEKASKVLSDAKGAGMDKAAALHHLTVTNADFVAADASLPGVGPAPEAMAQIFQFQKNSPGRIDAGNNVIIAEVVDAHPPATPTFEQARKQMEDRYRQERANQLLLQKSQELADRARNLQDIKKAAKVLNLPVKTSDLVAPNGQVPDIGSIGQNAPQIFDLNKGDISQPVRTATGAAVLQITDRQEPGPEELAKQKDQIRERLAADRRNQALNEFARNVRDRMMKDGTIKINKQEEARLTSGI